MASEPTNVSGTFDLPQVGWEEEMASIPTNQVSTVTPITSASVVKARSERYDFALGPDSPGVKALADNIASGFEDSVVSNAKLTIADRVRKTNEDTLKSLIQARGPQSATPEIIQEILSRNMPTADRDDLSIEREFSQKLIETSINTSKIFERYGPGLVEDPTSLARMNSFQRLSTAREGFNKLFEDVKSRWDAKGFGEKALSVGGSVIPGVQWYAITKGVSNETVTSVLPGSNVRDQIIYLYDLAQRDPKQAMAEARKAIDDIALVNESTAYEFAQALTSFGASDELLFNAIGVSDIVAAPFIAREAFKGGLALAGATASATRYVGRKGLNALGLIDATGNVERAGYLSIWNTLRNDARVTVSPKTFDDIKKDVVSLADVDAALTGVKHHSREFTQRLEVEMKGRAAELLNLARNQVSKGTVDGPTLTVALREATEKIRNQYPYLNDAVLDIRHIHPDDTLGRLDHTAVIVGKAQGYQYNPNSGLSVVMGRRGGVPFDTADAADKAAKTWYKLTDYDVIPYGGRFAIQVTRPIDLTATTVRDALAIQTAAETPKNFVNTWLGLLRSKDNLNSRDMVERLKVATYGGSGMQQELGRVVDQALGPLKRFRKDDLEELGTFLERQRDYVNQATKTRGRFSKDLGEFESHWYQNFNKLPKEDQTRAYFAMQQFNDFDYVFRNLQEWRYRSQQGRMLYGFNLKGTDFKQGMFEGRKVDSLPWGSNTPFNFIVLGDTPSDIQRYSVSRMMITGAARDAVDNLIQSGSHKIVQLSNDGLRAFQKADFLHRGNITPNEMIHYVVAPNIVESPLPFKVIPYKPGGHVLYGDGYVIRQPKISQSAGRMDNTYYNGDRALLHFVSEKEGRDMVPLLEGARKLLGDRPALDAYIKANLSHVFPTSTDFVKLFSSRGGGFDKNIPFGISRMGQSLDESMDFKTFLRSPEDTIIKASDNPHNLDNGRLKTEFVQERNLDFDGVYNGVLEPARKIDPVTTMLRSMGSLMRERHMTDLKVTAAEKYIAEFGSILDAKSIEEIRRAPLQYLLEPKYKAGADKATRAAAENMRLSVITLIDEAKSPAMKYWDAARASMAESVFRTLGEGRTYQFTASALENAAIKDPVRATRNMAFHNYMGLLNPVQLLLQAQSFATVAAIAGPLRASSAVGAGYLMRLTELSNVPGVKDFIAKASRTLGWKPQHFQESWQAMKDTGFARVGREYANIGDFIDQPLVQTKVGSALHHGTVLFREGETLVRLSAWNSAYSEWRAANKVAKLDGKAKAAILQRADALTNTMSTASDALIQKNGLVGIFTQFASHQARLWENIWTGLHGTNKSINRAEAARALAMNGLLYGVPVGIGGTLIGAMPVGTMYREYVLKKGGKDPEDTVGKVIEDGLVGIISEIYSGGRTNAAERLGPGGLTMFSDLLSLDSEKMVKALTGPSGRLMVDIWKNAKPVYAGALGAVTGDYQLDVRDFTDATDSISSVNSALKLYYALNYGKYITKAEGYLTDITAQEAYTNFFTGISPRDLSDAYLKLDIEKSRKSAAQFAREQAIIHFRRGFKSATDGDSETSVSSFKRAQAHMEGGGLSPQERIQVFKDATKDQSSLIDKAGERFARNDPQRFEQYIQELSKRQLRTRSIQE